MSIRRMEAPDLLSLDKFNVDEENPHVVIDPDVCDNCRTKPCLFVCPAVLYTLDKQGRVSYDYAGCLECGTCRVVCPNKGITKWEYPRSTCGVTFRYG